MIWHIAFAVSDLDQAMEQFGAALDLEWLPVKHFAGQTVDADGSSHPYETRLVFSNGQDCVLELFERVPGTAYSAAEGTAFHHMGFWTGDVGLEAERLAESGWAHRAGPTGPGARAAFFTSGLGILLEACNSTVERPGMERFYPGGPTGVGMLERPK